MIEKLSGHVTAGPQEPSESVFTWKHWLQSSVTNFLSHGCQSKFTSFSIATGFPSWEDVLVHGWGDTVVNQLGAKRAFDERGMCKVLGWENPHHPYCFPSSLRGAYCFSSSWLLRG